ncbi:ABC transporter ATP-binding protein [Rhizobium leguminosarum]|uniref:ABC transporter ATP-binding protein n=1 Tax=Rhizobium leguminosarum TaxID=384 RepID=UPI00102F6B22|nr:ABC transporter ATP-binding protein [Rhizobium leguminosarum]TBF67922.1 ABC transporter ATP-binding protein [Rhizobium leguminosarum]TBG95606.1 ABC transporter ATP-binding protein [Rhizobium leguminosarum]TBH27717.1 ABC transporter ATP-binding protein [Rhizobium leguminosarum]TBH47773.1 ABC transporter ATP-binding protein [Rhizobium leguminosarum]TBH63227.1 ABC transporter ATP-binding protein [Rhizobium leguminosarum]
MLGRVLRLDLSINWVRVTPVIALAAAAAILPVGVPLLLGYAIDAALQGKGVLELFPTFGLIVVLAIGGGAAELFTNALGARVGYGLSWQLARKLYSSLLRMPLLSYFTINPGVLNSRLTNDMRMVDPLFVSIPISFIHGWAGLLAVAIGLAFINAWFLAAFILVPIALLAVRFAEGRINATIRESYEVNARVALQIESTTSGDAVSLVRQAQATAAEERRFAELAEKSVEIASHMDVWRALIVVAYRLCFDLITVLFLAIGVFLASTGRASIGGVVSALFFVGLVRQPLGEVVGQRYPLIRAGMGLGRVEEVLASSNTGLTTIAATARPQPVDVTKPQLIFESVGYAYPARSDVAVKSLSDVAAANSAMSGFLAGVSLTKLVEAAPVDDAGNASWVLDDVSFSVSRGETVAVVGESGSGKSTIITLACGIVRPGRGRVHVGGVDTLDMSEEDVWKSVSLVSQDIYLRDATLRENLNYGREDVTDEELISALDVAGLGDLYKRLSEGLDTNVGQRGKRFSGGERQRVAIARAVLRDRPLLILDEATSHLDTQREEGILDAIQTIAENKAVLVVAHRLSAIERADRIVMLDKGRIVEHGRHAELIAANGPYSRMYRVTS